MNHELSSLIRERILQLIEARQISLTQLARDCHMTQSTLDNLINRQSSSPTIMTIKRICDGLGITLSEFFDTDAFDRLLPSHPQSESKPD